MFSKEAMEFINEFFGTYGFGRIIDGREYIGLVGEPRIPKVKLQ